MWMAGCGSLPADGGIELHLHQPPEPLNQRILLVATHYAILGYNGSTVVYSALQRTRYHYEQINSGSDTMLIALGTYLR